MTYEDVKKIRENPTLPNIDNDELSKMIDEAVEKQIAKEPIDEHIQIGKYKCFSCKNCLYQFLLLRQTYCVSCGQKLKWSDEE